MAHWVSANDMILATACIQCADDVASIEDRLRSSFVPVRGHPRKYRERPVLPVSTRFINRRMGRVPGHYWAWKKRWLPDGTVLQHQ